MKKVPTQTSRVSWQLGQALMPEHFHAQEQSIREELNLRLRMTSAAGWGIGSLRLEGFQLPQGIISIEEMTLVMPSGALIDVPGNTGPANVNISSAGSPASVYVHLLKDFDRVSVSKKNELADEGIQRIVQKIELSTRSFSDASDQTFHLADFQCDIHGQWSLLPTYIPPCLQVGATPFFAHAIERLDTILRLLQQTLLTEAEENYLAAEGNATNHLTMRGLHSFKARLNDLKAGVDLHPYELFSGLRELYIAVCAYRHVHPEEIERPYKHDALAECFSLLLQRLEEQAQPSRKNIPYVEFIPADGLLVCDLSKYSKEVRRARDIYFLVQKPQISARVDLSRVKLACESRIHAVYERSLKGIPFDHLDKPPFQHGLASTIEFYAITPGQEWDHAVRENKVVLIDSPQLRGLRFYTCWRPD